MGKKPDQIEHDIREHRAHISRRIESLKERVNEDVQTVRTEASDRASSAMDQAKGTANIDTVKEIMREHTLTTMAGALGVGVLLGVASEGIGSRGGGGGGQSNGYSGRNRTSGNEGSGGGIGSMLSSLVSPAAMTVQNELQELVKEGFGTLKQQVSQAGSSGESTTNGREAEAGREGSSSQQGSGQQSNT